MASAKPHTAVELLYGVAGIVAVIGRDGVAGAKPIACLGE